ncbi:MAG: hypothetical protein A2445_05220 [Candidatus Jacksonbacteria bacterium RIFOXYC2_FULL_44_29]|nr:MAG: hypothetical protein UW45_C0014G0032 [Parcubacteria group bacterium GW2011_GWC2_44_22]OGY75744.1 MAG: hypothetical protein A2240_06365 [Candidatus Jacksonbacteria bacterium RIFOXYA2_FULL_43_12]OGY78137.1 MAG: hypothetical protein A2445_05220 [Candidatus Jacksonbacteria bacterium RIFOXYC2_FULL_44_29]OGY80955.1 MAG: hypothetical protein A2550_02825 [Candidatus Jacksonbacteria bacterium RIFOXYD2_FULL_43_21]HBH46729.1 hypothetical protein [Candidatus Jacksonbacteria bacterium]
MSKKSYYFAILAIISFYCCFGVASAQTDSFGTRVGQARQREKIDALLYEILTAPNQSAAIADFGINLEAGHLPVNIYVNDLRYAMPAEDGLITKKNRDTFEAKIFPDKILSVAENPDVRRVELALNPVIIGGGNATSALAVQNKSFLLGLAVTLFLILVILILYLFFNSRQKHGY